MSFRLAELPSFRRAGISYALIKEVSQMDIKPLGDRVVIQPLEAEAKTKGGILLPDTAKEKPQEGKVIAVGKGKVLDSGAVQAPEVKVGDKVLYGKYSGNEITTKDGEELLIMREEDILAIIK
jgi:chaperonin GroES